MGLNIFTASRQWAERPQDERFWLMSDMIKACRSYRENSAESSPILGDLRVEKIDDDIQLIGKRGIPATLTHWSFGQVCRYARAKPDYLRTLSPTLASQCINYGLKHHLPNPDDEARILVHQNGGYVLRAISSERYVRVWNHEVLERLARSLVRGWRVPRARPNNTNGSDVRIATEADVFPGSSIRVGDKIGPAGLYASDHDMFVFMVNPERTIDAGYGDHGLMTGLMVGNSEVVKGSFWIAAFLFDHVCGNHIIWDVAKYVEVRIPHVGDAEDKIFDALNGLGHTVQGYLESGVSEVEAKIKEARNRKLGDDKEEVVENMFKLSKSKSIGIPKRTFDAAYDIAEKEPRYGDPRMAWAMTNGLTELSQQSGYADRRNDLDMAAGKILDATL